MSPLYSICFIYGLVEPDPEPEPEPEPLSVFVVVVEEEEEEAGGAVTTVPAVTAAAVAVTVACTLEAVGLRLGATTVMPKALADETSELLMLANAVELDTGAGVIAPEALTAETGVASIKAANVALASKPLLAAILANIAPTMSSDGTGLLSEGGVGTAKMLMFAGKPKAKSVREAPSARVAADTEAGATYAEVPSVAGLIPASLAAMVVKGVTPTLATEFTEAAAVAREIAEPLTLRPVDSSKYVVFALPVTLIKTAPVVLFGIWRVALPGAAEVNAPVSPLAKTLPSRLYAVTTPP